MLLTNSKQLAILHDIDLLNEDISDLHFNDDLGHDYYECVSDNVPLTPLSSSSSTCEIPVKRKKIIHIEDEDE